MQKNNSTMNNLFVDINCNRCVKVSLLTAMTQEKPGRMVQWDSRSTGDQEDAGSILRSTSIFPWKKFPPTSDPSRVHVAVGGWRKDGHVVLVNRLRGLSLPRKSVVRGTDCLQNDLKYVLTGT